HPCLVGLESAQRLKRRAALSLQQQDERHQRNLRTSINVARGTGKFDQAQEYVVNRAERLYLVAVLDEKDFPVVSERRPVLQNAVVHEGRVTNLRERIRHQTCCRCHNGCVSIPVNIAPIWSVLYDESVAVHAYWKLFKQLFSGSQDDLDLLNRSASFCFY